MPPKRVEHDEIHQGQLPKDSQSDRGREQKRLVKKYRTEVAASISSVLATFATFPLDSVKTRMQTYKYPSFTYCVRYTYKTEKFGGFFRGVTAPLASVTMVRTISFSVYQQSKYRMSEWCEKNFGINPLVHVNTPGTYPTFATAACFGASGAVAGSFITLVSCPFELTKLSAQVSVLMADRNNSSVSEPSLNRTVVSNYQTKGTLQTAKNIIKHQGIMGLYSGFRLHLLRDVVGTGAYFMTYESLKQFLTSYRKDTSPTNPFAVLFAGGLCGVASWALIYPIDSAKSIYQKNCLASHQGGIRKKAPKVEFFNKRMYRGLGVSMGRSALVNSIFFSSFEFIKKEINALD